MPRSSTTCWCCWTSARPASARSESDLYWPLFKNRASVEDQKYILSTYCDELARHGVAVTEEEIRTSAMARYAQKWLFPSRRGTMASIGHLQDTQRAVLELLRKLKAPKAKPEPPAAK